MSVVVGVALAAVALGGCGILGGPGLPDGVQRVGPEVSLGPVPVFGGGDGDAGHVVFFQTSDGWCTQWANSLGCQGGGGLPTGFGGVSTDTGSERTCLETSTGKNVVELEVVREDGTVTSLKPLAGNEQVPVNVFAACWRPGFDVRNTVVTGFGAAGNEVGSERLGPPAGVEPAVAN